MADIEIFKNNDFVGSKYYRIGTWWEGASIGIELKEQERRAVID